MQTVARYDFCWPPIVGNAAEKHDSCSRTRMPKGAVEVGHRIRSSDRPVQKIAPLSSLKRSAPSRAERASRLEEERNLHGCVGTPLTPGTPRKTTASRVCTPTNKIPWKSLPLKNTVRARREQPTSFNHSSSETIYGAPAVAESHANHLPCRQTRDSHRQCWCGDDDYDKHGESTSCTMACSGDSSETCGGRNSMSVYKNEDRTPTPTPVSSSSEYVGCYADTRSDRIMTDKQATSDMTAEVCTRRRTHATRHSVNFVGTAEWMTH